MPRCVANFCNGCLNHLEGYSCGECKYCLDHPKSGGHNKHRKPCLFRWCVSSRTGGRDVERKGAGGEGVARVRGRVRQAEGGPQRCNSCTGCRNRREGFLCDRWIYCRYI